MVFIAPSNLQNVAVYALNESYAHPMAGVTSPSRSLPDSDLHWKRGKSPKYDKSCYRQPLPRAPSYIGRPQVDLHALKS